MPDLERNGDNIKAGISSNQSDDPSDHMWSIYVAEAEKFDKALVDSWKGDMDGILIFAGLFSASVTAFIIESYKKLSPDSGDATVTLLTQISYQLVAISNGTNLIPNVPSPPPADLSFHPTSSVVAVNILWFLSLVLALVCALSATMVEQWARNYLQLIERRPTPSKRARIRAYMYEGVKKFKMTAVVEAIPTLLHASLFLFIIGLVIFLFPIDLRVALTMLVVLTIIVSFYAAVTFLPIRHKNCPYQTPLSPTCWSIMQRFNLLWYFESDGKKEHIRGSIADGRELLATASSPEQADRDVAALEWMLESATDYSQLEQVFDAVHSFYRPSASNTDYVLGELGLKVFDRSVPILRECVLQANIQSLTRQRRAVACMTALQVVAPKLPFMSSRWQRLVKGGNPLDALRTDSDTTIATLAMCTKATLAASFLFTLTRWIPSKSHTLDNDAADEQFLMEISDRLPVLELAASMEVQGYPHYPTPIAVASSLPAGATSDALHILKSHDVMDAADRYLKCCRASTSGFINNLIPTTLMMYQFEVQGLKQLLKWISPYVIEEAELCVQYLRDANQFTDGWSTNRAVWGLSRMLQGLRMKKRREEFMNCSRLTITNTLLSQVMEYQHDTLEHSAFILETLHRIYAVDASPWKWRVPTSVFSVYDVDQEILLKCIRIVKDALSPIHGIPPVSFFVIEPLIHILSDVEHPVSVALVIDAIDGNQWLLDNNFPLEVTVQRLRAKLLPQVETITRKHTKSESFQGHPGPSHVKRLVRSNTW